MSDYIGKLSILKTLYTDDLNKKAASSATFPVAQPGIEPESKV